MKKLKEIIKGYLYRSECGNHVVVGHSKPLRDDFIPSGASFAKEAYPPQTSVWSEVVTWNNKLAELVKKMAEELENAVDFHERHNDCGGLSSTEEDCCWCTDVKDLLAQYKALNK